MRDVVAAAAVRDSTLPQAMPLAMLTMEKETLGFHSFYALFSSLSSIFIGMGLRCLALWAGEFPLLNKDLLLKISRTIGVLTPRCDDDDDDSKYNSIKL